jgi:hypothetical protein
MKHLQGADELVAMVHRLLSSRGEKLVQQNRVLFTSWKPK